MMRERDDDSIDDDDERINTITEMVKLIFYLYTFSLITGKLLYDD